MRFSTSFSVSSALLAAALFCYGCDDKVPQAKPESVTIKVDAEGNFYWNDELATCEELEARVWDNVPESSQVPSICGAFQALPSKP